uniref:Odorant receptor n=2 Tax=Heortia vitessoides TaxID=1557813 RepID=A0A978W706_9NEOP|nr:odorant receptor 1 [Heortia vitessoides]
MSLAGSSVAPHLVFLRRCGFCRIPRLLTAPKKPARKGGAPRPTLAHQLHALYCTFALAVTTVYLVQECVYAYQERHDMDKLARVMFLLLCHVTSISKQLVFYVEADKIHEMVAAFDLAEYNQRRGAAQLRDTARSARRLLRAYSGTAVLTCTLWIIFPVLYYVQGLPVEFPFWTHLDHTRPLVFVLLLMYSYYVTTLVGIANTTMDAFIGTVLYQCKTQLRILRINFETLMERAQDKVNEDPSVPYDVVLSKLFLECLHHYEQISKTNKRLQDIFGTAILVQFGIGGWILCMAAYKLISLNVLSIEFASMTLFITCILTELFLYCYYGNEVTVESDRVLQSLYGMEWLRAPAPLKRSLVLVMERAKRPLRPAAGLIIPLSLNTFVTILKSSYTFYAVLRQTK